jgi:hypothetical protein
MSASLKGVGKTYAMLVAPVPQGPKGGMSSPVWSRRTGARRPRLCSSRQGERVDELEAATALVEVDIGRPRSMHPESAG